MGDEVEWLPSSVAVFAGDAATRSRGRSTCCGSARSRCARGSGSGSRSCGSSAEAAPWRTTRTHRAGLDRGAMGAEAWEKVWGPMLRGKFGDRAEESRRLAVGQLTTRRQIKGREAREEVLGYPRGGWQPVLERLRDGSRGRRPGPDRPPGGRPWLVPVRLRSSDFGGAPDSFREDIDPAGFEMPASETMTRWWRRCRTNLPCVARPRAGGRGRDEYLARLDSIEYHQALCLLLEVDRRFSPLLLDQHRRSRIPFIGLIEQTNLIPPERYGGGRFLYVANYLADGDPLLDLDPRSCWPITSRLCAAESDYSPEWVKRAGCFREPDAQPVVTLGYREAESPR